MTLIDVHPGDVVRLRKAHPCGGYDWLVTRIGTDIGLQCQTCQRRVMLPRSDFNKRFKAFISRFEASTATDA